MVTAKYLQFMAEAIDEARRGEAEGEVPVGAIEVADGQIVSAGHNQANRARRSDGARGNPRNLRGRIDAQSVPPDGGVDIHHA